MGEQGDGQRSPMVEARLLLPRRIWTVIERYAGEAAERARERGEPAAAVEILRDAERMAAVLLEQLVEGEERIRRRRATPSN